MSPAGLVASLGRMLQPWLCLKQGLHVPNTCEISSESYVALIITPHMDRLSPLLAGILAFIQNFSEKSALILYY